jgi:hypothetical protein
MDVASRMKFLIESFHGTDPGSSVSSLSLRFEVSIGMSSVVRGLPKYSANAGDVYES